MQIINWKGRWLIENATSKHEIILITVCGYQLAKKRQNNAENRLNWMVLDGWMVLDW